MWTVNLTKYPYFFKSFFNKNIQAFRNNKKNLFNKFHFYKFCSKKGKSS